MKSKSIILAALLVMPFVGHSQTNTPGTFFQSVENYFTAFDTNSTTFVGDKFDVTMGTASIQNSQLASDFLAEFQVKNPLSLEVDIRNATIAGQVISYQGGLGYNITHFDTRLTGYLDAGYKSDINLAYIAPGLRVKKALTANTYGMVGLELPIYFKKVSPVPTFIVGAGFRF